MLPFNYYHNRKLSVRNSIFKCWCINLIVQFMKKLRLHLYRDAASKPARGDMYTSGWCIKSRKYTDLRLDHGLQSAPLHFVWQSPYHTKTATVAQNAVIDVSHHHKSTLQFGSRLSNAFVGSIKISIYCCDTFCEFKDNSTTCLKIIIPCYGNPIIRDLVYIHISKKKWTRISKWYFFYDTACTSTL